jgi:RES domain-containing protein
MDFWRLYRAAHGPGLDGAGGLHAAGRWHEQGSPVVYFGASPAIVVLEKLAHIDPRFLPDDLMLARYAAQVDVEESGLTSDTPMPALDVSRERGMQFLRAHTACALRVPSIVVPEERNLMLNPLHPDAAKLRLVSKRAFVFDQRVLGA